MPPKPTGHQVLGAALAFVVMAAAIGVGVMQLTTPNPAPADIPADQFSAARAMATVEAIAGNGIPHPGGSADNKRVREQLVAEIRVEIFALRQDDDRPVGHASAQMVLADDLQGVLRFDESLEHAA